MPRFKHRGPSQRARRLGPIYDPFAIDGTEGDFYRVTLPDGVPGFIYAHNVPLTNRQQHDADDRAAAAARPTGGWRGTLNRVLGKH